MQALAVDKHILLVRRSPVKGSGPESPDLCLRLALLPLHAVKQQAGEIKHAWTSRFHVASLSEEN